MTGHPIRSGTSRWSGRRVVAIVVLATTAASACSGDDAPELTYCETLRELSSEQGAIGPDAGAQDDALALYRHLVSVAPDEVADAAVVVSDAAAIVARDGDDSEVDTDAAAEASARMVASAAETCDLDLTLTG